MIIFKGHLSVVKEGGRTVNLTQYQVGGWPTLSFKDWDSLVEWAKGREQAELEMLEQEAV